MTCYVYDRIITFTCEFRSDAEYEERRDKMEGVAKLKANGVTLNNGKQIISRQYQESPKSNFVNNHKRIDYLKYSSRSD